MLLTIVVTVFNEKDTVIEAIRQVEKLDLEKEIIVGELRKRFDILVYDPAHRPWLMVECKAMEVTLGENTVHQVLRYNLGMPVRFLVITNGRECYVWEKMERTILPKDGFPEFGS